jgi:hypothetical protein
MGWNYRPFVAVILKELKPNKLIRKGNRGQKFNARTVISSNPKGVKYK